MARNKTMATTSREKEPENRAVEVREQKTNLAEFLKELIDRIAVLGFKLVTLLVSYYSSGALKPAFDYASLSSKSDSCWWSVTQTFTERFKPRLVEMAAWDTELTVHIAVIGAVAARRLLEDEQREKQRILVFDEAAKVCRAVSEFIRGVWAEIVEEMLGNGKGKQERTRAGVEVTKKSKLVISGRWRYERQPSSVFLRQPLIMNPSNTRKREQLPDTPQKRQRIVLNVRKANWLTRTLPKWTLVLLLLRPSCRRHRPPPQFKKPTCPEAILCADVRSAPVPECNNRLTLPPSI
ncbi:hypothetical protein H4582DRAFT_2202101 [Lactarius indigo]|nr:hypothetical protein H4582DRAFT_2202101 [Lactarius indigo]